MKLLLFPYLLLLPACTAQQSSPFSALEQGGILQRGGTTIATRFNPPSGYKRIPATERSYAAFLRNQSLYPHGTPVLYYDGRMKPNPDIYAAVLKLDRGIQDLQQCADAVMRLRAEWLYSIGRFDDIHFNLTNGFPADYRHWQNGNRLLVKGSKTSWVKTAQPANNYASFRKYLDVVYAYASTRSLAKEMKQVAFSDMQAGDVLIVAGSPGHAVTVMDMARNAAGAKVFMLSQSYMPAQDIQILCNPDNAAINPWYELRAGAASVHTPQWDFTTADLKRFVAP